MKTLLLFTLVMSVLCTPTDSFAQTHFRKQLIAAESYESVGVFDVNNDGNLDIVSGAYWYEGPGFIQRHYIGNVNRTGNGGYWDDFANIPMDINGDGYMDYVSGDWFSKSIWWRENPGNDHEEWKLHLIDTSGNVESIRAWDVDGDGTLEIIPNIPGGSLKFYKLKKSGQGIPSGEFDKVVVAPHQEHGLGFGDINGDGRGDFVVSDGWIEAPKDPVQGKWIWHEFQSSTGEMFNLGTASVPILVQDLNADGHSDLIVGQAHDYGLDWYEQVKSKSGKISWIKHAIDPFNSQYHTMEWEDIDGDGRKELITGKRYRAHNGGDPGSNDPYGLYYFKWNGDSFTKNTISYGIFGQGKGTGLHFAIADLHHTGRKDIIVAGKDGLCVFYNKTNNLKK